MTISVKHVHVHTCVAAMGITNYSLLVLVILFSSSASRWNKTVLTYNAALLELLGLDTLGPGADIPIRTDRRDAMIDQLKNTSADVICLQEIWYGEDVAAITQSLVEYYPYSFSSIHADNGTVPLDGYSEEPPCSTALFMPLVICYQTNCLGTTTTTAALGCIFSSCFSEFNALPQDCWNCMLLTGLNLTEIGIRCSGLGPGLYRRPNEAGLVLLSKDQMTDQQYTDLHPSTRELLVKAYLQAMVSGIGLVVCTHLSVGDNLVYTEFELQAMEGLTSFIEQNKVEVTEITERFGDEEKVIIAGDFNTGPSVYPGVAPEVPNNFAVLAKVFSSDIVSQCTFCSSPENYYNVGFNSVTIDHVLYKGYKSVSRKIVFDDVTINGYPLSDHFGVMHTFRKFAKCRRHK